MTLLILCVVAFHERATLPSPGLSYTQRLAWLNGSQASMYAGEGLDCESFILNARGKAVPYGDFYSMHPKTVKPVAVFESITQVDESVLRPGDVLASSQHVAAYLGHGRFVDADYRRGSVQEWSLADKSPSDTWFRGPVKILRFCA